jgi:hypothetical protein
MSDGNQIPSGGAELRGLDPTNPKDLALIRQTIKNRPKRWAGVTPEVKETILRLLSQGVVKAGDMLENSNIEIQSEGIKHINSAAKTLVMMEGQCQADEHLDEKHARLDAGLTTENVALQDAALLRADPDARAKALEVARLMNNASDPNIHT